MDARVSLVFRTYIYRTMREYILDCLVVQRLRLCDCLSRTHTVETVRELTVRAGRRMYVKRFVRQHKTSTDTHVCVYIRRFSFNVHGIRKLCPGSTGRADVGPYIVIRSLHGRSRGIAIFVRIVVVYTPPGAENLYSPTIVAFPSPFICFFPGTLFSRVRPVISSRENERQI